MIEPYIFDLFDKSFEFSGVTQDIGYTYSCKQSGCHDEGICRCGEITTRRITNVNMSRVVGEIVHATFGNLDTQKRRDSRINELLGQPSIELLHYAVDRICRSHKLWSPERWHIQVGNGYYGQEVEGVYIIKETASALVEDIVRICQLDNVEDVVEALMLLEYGSVHQDLQDCVYEERIVDLEKVRFAAVGHLSNVLKKDTRHYSDENYKGIRGVVVPHGDGYRAIDGYHRMNSTKLKQVKVLVATKIV